MSPKVQDQSFPSPASSKRTHSTGTLGKNDFLKMLIMQLRHQDPLNPMKGTEFAAQLAQFSSLEQLANINTNLLQSVDSSFLISQSISNALAATFVGKEVKAIAEEFYYEGSGEARLGYILRSEAESVVVKIFDESGTLVKTIPATATGAGEHTLTWTGKNEKGESVSPGKYTFTVEGKHPSGAAVNAPRFIIGKVMSVRFKSEGTVFVIGGVEISLSNVLEIMFG